LAFLAATMKLPVPVVSVMLIMRRLSVADGQPAPGEEI